MFYNKAQSLTEYIMIVMLVVAALAAMQVYMKRGIQASFKAAADELAITDSVSRKRSYKNI